MHPGKTKIILRRGNRLAGSEAVGKRPWGHIGWLHEDVNPVNGSCEKWMAAVGKSAF